MNAVEIPSASRRRRTCILHSDGIQIEHRFARAGEVIASSVDLEVNNGHHSPVLDPTSSLQALLAHLTTAAQGRGLNDAQWATAAGLPKETLSRLRRRTDCDFATLRALAEAAGTDLAVVTPASVSPDGHMPRRVDRDYEARLVALCVSGSVDPEIWRLLGPPFFMAGLAVMLASVTGADRKRLLALAEALHPGITEPVVFQTWLTRSPVRPSRFLPMFREAIRRAA